MLGTRPKQSSSSSTIDSRQVCPTLFEGLVPKVAARVWEVARVGLPVSAIALLLARAKAAEASLGLRVRDESGDLRQQSSEFDGLGVIIIATGTKSLLAVTGHRVGG